MPSDRTPRWASSGVRLLDGKGEALSLVSIYYDHEFDSVVAYHDVGSDRYRYTVIYLPKSLESQLPLKQHPRLRVSAEVNDYPIEAAFTPSGGSWYLLLSKKLLKAINAHVGDAVTVRFRITDQAAVDVPEALQDALAEQRSMAELWKELTPGKQRGLAYRVASAKRAETQARRIAEVFEILEGKRDFRGKPTQT